MPRKSSPKKRSAKSRSSRSDSTQRLQRLLASAGFGSRRQCEDLIEAGRVEVDGTIVTKLGTTVDPSTQKVRVDGVLLKKQKLVYYAVNKPVGFVTTNRDPHGRPRVIDLVPRDERVFPVGRLDRNSEGLILLTNDGELAQKLTHPKFGVRKVYRVTVAGKVDGETMRQMRKGIHIAEGFVRVEGAKLLKARSRSTEMEIILREGKNREIRRILARLGHKVQHLRRIAVGPLRLGEVPSGAYRVVSNQEVEKLWRATETESEPGSSPRATKKRGLKSRGVKSRGGRPPGKGKVSSSTRRPSKKPAGKRRLTSSPGDAAALKLGQSRTEGAIIGGESSDHAIQPTRRSKVAGKKAAGDRSGNRSRKRKSAKSGQRGGAGGGRATKKSSGRRGVKRTSKHGTTGQRGKTASRKRGKRS